MDFDETTQDNIVSWLKGAYDEKTKAEIRELLQKDPQKLKDAFSKTLSFGTGAVSALMGIGTNRLNIYTIRAMAQGVSNYLKKTVKDPSLLIGFDNRNNSQLFAEETAKVLAADNIKVYLFKNLRPTPLVSFGCRFKKCSAAIMITASHLPPEYNGFKVYWEDGAQVAHPHDTNIKEEVNKITSTEEIKTAPLPHHLVEMIEEEIDHAYIEALRSLKSTCYDLNIIYTNLHGTGITILPTALADWGFKNISFVEEQKTCDGNFPFARDPSFENEKIFEPGIELLMQKKADILIATDPDADRLAVVVNDHNITTPLVFPSNQIAALLLNYILSRKPVPKKSICIKTLVTTELVKAICNSYGIICLDVLPGFKHVTEKMQLFEKMGFNYVFGADEYCGYLPENFARDKDAISSACIIAEYTSILKKDNSNFVDELITLYQKFGVFREKLLSITFVTQQEQKSFMQDLRECPPEKIAGQEVVKIEEGFREKLIYINFHDKRYFKCFTQDLRECPPKKITSPEPGQTEERSDMLKFFLSDNTEIIIIPSETEPKVKFHLRVAEKNFRSLKDAVHTCDDKLNRITFTLTRPISDQ